MHDVGRVSWVGSVLYRSCSTDPAQRLRTACQDLHDLDGDLSDLCKIAIVVCLVPILQPRYMGPKRDTSNSFGTQEYTEQLQRGT